MRIYSLLQGFLRFFLRFCLRFSSRVNICINGRSENEPLKVQLLFQDSRPPLRPDIVVSIHPCVVFSTGLDWSVLLHLAMTE